MCVGIEYAVALTLHCECDVHNAAQICGSSYREIGPYPMAFLHLKCMMF